MNEIIVDSFAGGGGASQGILEALGRSPDIAINHDREAIALHAANHPDSLHLAEDVWHVDPVEACAGRPVGLMWLSPDCKHFSKAKGGKPVSKKIRGLAWVAVRWAKAVRPRVIVLENVEEFQTWGPVDRLTNIPHKERRGETFRSFCSKLRRLGYDVQHRELRACDYGAPTIRKRLFLIARCDGVAITWPTPTHGKNRPLPWRTAAECIQWEIPCPSIFLTKDEGRAIGVKRPLADATMRRIARGIKRFVIDSPTPFIVPMQHVNRPTSVDEPLQTITTQGNKFNLVTPYIVPLTHHGENRGQRVDEPIATITGAHRGEQALIAPYLTQRYGEWGDHPARGSLVSSPVPTIVPTGNSTHLVAAFMAKHYGGNETPGSQLGLPLSTVTTQDHNHLVTAHIQRDFGKSIGAAMDGPVPTITGGGGGHASLVRAFLVQYYSGGSQAVSLFDPAPAVVSKDRIGIVKVEGVDYAIADISMRMLAPRELYRAQGFPDSYRIEIEFNGKPLTKTAQVRMVGNSVCPPLAAAIVRENARDLAHTELAA